MIKTKVSSERDVISSNQDFYKLYGSYGYDGDINEDRFRRLSWITNKYLETYQLWWNTEEGFLEGKSDLTEEMAKEKLEEAYQKAKCRLKSWEKKVNILSGILVCAFGMFIVLFFSEALDQTHGFVWYCIFVVALCFSLPWWLNYILKAVESFFESELF